MAYISQEIVFGIEDLKLYLLHFESCFAKEYKDHRQILITNNNFTVDFVVQPGQLHYKKRVTVVNIEGVWHPISTIRKLVSPRVPSCFLRLWQRPLPYRYYYEK